MFLTLDVLGKFFLVCVLCACREIDFQEEGFTINLKDIHKFVDEYEVELVARCCRWGPLEQTCRTAM
jgi:hypothetical protein